MHGHLNVKFLMMWVGGLMLRASFNGSVKYDFRIALKGTEELISDEWWCSRRIELTE